MVVLIILGVLLYKKTTESKLNITKEEITKKLGKSFTRFFLIKAIITMVINWKNTIKN